MRFWVFFLCANNNNLKKNQYSGASCRQWGKMLLQIWRNCWGKLEEVIMRKDSAWGYVCLIYWRGLLLLFEWVSVVSHWAWPDSCFGPPLQWPQAIWVRPIQTGTFVYLVRSIVGVLQRDFGMIQKIPQKMQVFFLVHSGVVASTVCTGQEWPEMVCQCGCHSPAPKHFSLCVLACVHEYMNAHANMHTCISTKKSQTAPPAHCHSAVPSGLWHQAVIPTWWLILLPI